MEKSKLLIFIGDNSELKKVWTGWFISVIPASREVDIGSIATHKKLARSASTNKQSIVHMPVIPAT
jgi:hypothetical protein